MPPNRIANFLFLYESSRKVAMLAQSVLGPVSHRALSTARVRP